MSALAFSSLACLSTAPSLAASTGSAADTSVAVTKMSPVRSAWNVQYRTDGSTSATRRAHR